MNDTDESSGTIQYLLQYLCHLKRWVTLGISVPASKTERLKTQTLTLGGFIQWCLIMLPAVVLLGRFTTSLLESLQDNSHSSPEGNRQLEGHLYTHLYRLAKHAWNAQFVCSSLENMLRSERHVEMHAFRKVLITVSSSLLWQCGVL